MNLKRSNQNLNRTEFINDLRLECALHFEPEIATAVVMEVDAHLADSIQARIELGDSAEEAEINAVRSFHQPQKFVRSMGQIHRDEAEHDRPLFAIGLAFLCWVAFYIEIAPKQFGWIVGLLGVLILGASILIRSAQIGSLRLRTLRCLGLAAILIVGLIAPLGIVNLWAYGGMGYMPNHMARELVSDQEGFIRARSGGTESAASYVGDFAEMTREDAGPAKRALDAPLLERYTTNASQTVPSLIFCMGLIFVGHLLPVAIRRRWNRRRAARRGMVA